MNLIFFAEINTLLEQMNDKSLQLKTEMLRLTEQVKLYEQRHSSSKTFFSNKAVLHRHGLSGTNKDPVTLSKIETYVILCRENLFE